MLYTRQSFAVRPSFVSLALRLSPSASSRTLSPTNRQSSLIYSIISTATLADAAVYTCIRISKTRAHLIFKIMDTHAHYMRCMRGSLFLLLSSAYVFQSSFSRGNKSTATIYTEPASKNEDSGRSGAPDHLHLLPTNSSVIET